jgi:hypothetical protein
VSGHCQIIAPIIAIACVIFLAFEASAASCRNFVREARDAIGKPMATLVRLEHEASDRLKGLDTRPFDILRDEARKVMTVVGDPLMLKDEEGLERCRNATKPIRKICADAGGLLATIVEKHAAEPKPDYDRPQYAAAIAECEKLLDLKPLKSLIRGTD